MNDFQKRRAADAELIRERCGNKVCILSIYKGREILRPVAIGTDDIIEVLCGKTWHRAWVSPSGLRSLMVK